MKLSRRSALLILASVAPALSLGAPAAAQTAQGSDSAARQSDGAPDDHAIAERMLRSGTLTTPRRRCGERGPGGEIVVCAVDNSQFRVKSTSETDPDSREALDDGRLHAPDVSGNGIFKGKPTMSGMCLVPPCPPEKAYIVDLSSLPPPPADSDADKIAKGELRDR